MYEMNLLLVVIQWCTAKRNSYYQLWYTEIPKIFSREKNIIIWATFIITGALVALLVCQIWQHCT